MQKQQIFEYAVLYHERFEDNGKPGEIKGTKILVDVTRVTAATPQEATLLAARRIPEEYLDKLSDIEVAVRPF